MIELKKYLRRFFATEDNAETNQNYWYNEGFTDGYQRAINEHSKFLASKMNELLEHAEIKIISEREGDPNSFEAVKVGVNDMPKLFQSSYYEFRIIPLRVCFCFAPFKQMYASVTRPAKDIIFKKNQVARLNEEKNDTDKN